MRRAKYFYAFIAIFITFDVLLVVGCVWWVQGRPHETEESTPVTPRVMQAANPFQKTLAAPPGTQQPLTAIEVAEDLPSTPAGSALAICDPLASNAGSDTAAFGAGCTRWLQYAMYNYPQLGQMMNWSEQERALPELGISNLRLNASQAQQLGRMIGYTHVAASVITGTPARCTLTLQIYAIPGNAATGQTCSATGSEAEIIAALPQLAQQLLTRIAVQTSAPPAPSLTADDLRAIGNYDWWPKGRPSPALQQRMQTMGQRDALAGLLYLLHNSGREEAYRRLFAQAPTNLEARAECLQIFDALSHSMQIEVVKGLPPLPNNLIVARARLDSAQTPQDLVNSAEHMVQCAPRNPVAWVLLAEMYSRVSSHLRNARNMSQISPDEWKALDRLYAHELSAAQQAAALNPLYGPAWTEIVGSGMCAGKPDVADEALWKAIQLNRSNARTYFLGMEMYQPKWFGDAAKLDKVARLAAADTSLNPAGRKEVEAELQKIGRVTEAQQMEAQAKSGR